MLVMAAVITVREPIPNSMSSASSRAAAREHGKRLHRQQRADERRNPACRLEYVSIAAQELAEMLC